VKVAERVIDALVFQGEPFIEASRECLIAALGSSLLHGIDYSYGDVMDIGQGKHFGNALVAQVSDEIQVLQEW
jgi:hypothetical protein